MSILTLMLLGSLCVLLTFLVSLCAYLLSSPSCESSPCVYPRLCVCVCLDLAVPPQPRSTIHRINTWFSTLLFTRLLYSPAWWYASAFSPSSVLCSALDWVVSSSCVLLPSLPSSSLPLGLLLTHLPACPLLPGSAWIASPSEQCSFCYNKSLVQSVQLFTLHLTDAAELKCCYLCY